MTRYWAIGLGLFALVMRCLAANGDLWFDEIWSLRLMQSVDSPVAILTGINHDNNHPLNSLWLRLCGPQASNWTYRSASIVSGTLSVVIAGSVLLGRGRAAAIFVWLLLGASFPLIQYSSEARGYGFELLFAVVLLAAMWQFEKSASARLWSGIVLLAGIGGSLAHATFLLLIAGIWIVFVCRHADQLRKPPELSRLIPIMIGLPAIAVGAYFLVYHGLRIGGGESQSAVGALCEMLSAVAGGPRTGPLSIGCCVLVLILSTLFIRELYEGENKARILYLMAAIVSPIAGIIVSPGDLIYPRYFLVSAIAGLWVISWGLSLWWEKRGYWRVGAIVIAVLMVFGNLIRSSDLILIGRGSYSGAIEYMAQRSTRPVSIGGDHDFRTSMLLEYYTQRAKRTESITYVKQSQWPTTGLDWMILHTTHEPSTFPLDIQDPHHNTYVLRKVFRYSGMSGWHWALYQLEANSH